MKPVFTGDKYHGSTFFTGKSKDQQFWRLAAYFRTIHFKSMQDIDRLGLLKRIILTEEPRNETP